MSQKAPATSFNPEFLASLQKQNQTRWQCKACYSYNDNTVAKCRACDADRPSDVKVPASEKRDAPTPAPTDSAPEEKKPKFGGFTPGSFPSTTGASKTTFPSFFNKSTSNSASTGMTFKFGVGANAVSIPVATKQTVEEKKEEIKEEIKEEEKKEEIKEESDDSDYMKYDSDGGEEQQQLAKEDYTEDEQAVDVMENRTTIPCTDCITTETPISKSCESYELYVIGSGDCGQLGLGEECTQIGKPLLNKHLVDKQVSRIACGSLFNMVLSTDKKSVYSWGVNDEGELARDGEETIPDLIKKGELKKKDTIEVIDAGDCHAAILSDKGKVYCWGTYRDSRGILGWSKDMKKQEQPTEIKFPRGTVITRVCCGENHTLALASDYTCYGWGCGEQGQLVSHMKESMRKRALVPHVIAFYEGRKKRKIQTMWAGGMHSLFLLDNGQLMACGLNNWGQLGCGVRYENVNDPEHISFFDDKKIVQAALSQHATVVLTEDGKLYSAGRNSYGQLGRKTKEEYDASFGLVELPEGVKIQQIACGSHHYMAVDEKGLLYTWGFGDMEQLGNGKYEDETLPYHVKSKVLADRRVIMIDAGAQHSVVLATPLNS